MFKVKFLVLIVLFSASVIKAATVTVNLEFNPQVFTDRAGTAGVSVPGHGAMISDAHTSDLDWWVSEVPMPFNDAVTLSAGDVLQLNVHFTGNKMLEVINSPSSLEFDLLLSSIDDWSGWTGIELDNLQIDVLHYQNLSDPHLSGYVWTNDSVSAIESFASTNSPSAMTTNGAMIGDFTLGLTIPAQLPNRNIPPTTTYSFNYIKIEAFGSTSLSPGNFLQVVPEPASFLLFAFAGLAAFRTNRFYRNRLNENLT